MNSDDIMMLKFFINKIVNVMSSRNYKMPFIRFLFSKEDLDRIKGYVDLEDFANLESIKILEKNIEDYETNIEKDVFIKIEDMDEFFNLLSELVCENDMSNGELRTIDILKSIWLRMGVEDIENVNSFLKKQINFFKSNNNQFY